MMRKLLLASAALMFTAGAALAQTAASPAPDGAVNAPVETSGAGSSPGKTAPEPAPLASSPSATSNGSNEAMNAPAAMPVHHHWMHHNEGGTLPANADAGTYLHIARQAIAHGDKMRAEDALSHAETRLLSRAVPQSDSNPVDQSPAITAIENARAALRSGDMSTAASDTASAWHQVKSEE